MISPSLEVATHAMTPRREVSLVSASPRLCVRPMNRWSTVRLIVLALGIPLSGTQQCLAQATPAAPLDFALARVQPGERITGRITALDSRRTEILTSAGKASVPWSDVESLVRSAVPSVAPPVPPLVMLTTGDVLRARPVALTEDRLLATWEDFPDLDHLSIPLELVRGVWSPATDGQHPPNPASPPVAAPYTRWWNRLLDQAANHDTLWLTNGDTLTGELRGLGEGRYRLVATGETNETDVPSDAIEGWRLNTELLSVPATLEAGLTLLLLDGSRIVARHARLVNEVLELETRFGSVLRVPLLNVVEVRPFGGSVRYLSDLEPAEYRHTPLLRLAWPLVRDRSVVGGPLAPGGTLAVKGLGMHATSEVRYDLTNDDREFRTRLGVDSAAGTAGSLIGEVLLDDRVVYRSPVLTGTDPPVDVPPIPVRGGKSLVLRVLAGPRGDIRDLADWADARLVK